MRVRVRVDSAGRVRGSHRLLLSGVFVRPSRQVGFLLAPAFEVRRFCSESPGVPSRSGVTAACRSPGGEAGGHGGGRGWELPPGGPWLVESSLLGASLSPPPPRHEGWDSGSQESALPEPALAASVGSRFPWPLEWSSFSFICDNRGRRRGVS